MSAFTPGPWVFENWPESYSICNARGSDVLWAGQDATLRCNEADARLIAAAPELLEALREITADYSDRFDLDSPSTNPGIKSSIKQARAAILKATGGDK